MKNRSLAMDYLERARVRIRAIEVLAEAQSHADVVRESQEVIELALKALIRASNIEVPRIHDVSPVLVENLKRLPEDVRPHVDYLCSVSRKLRRDRELAFYGSEDLVPSEFYRAEDGEEALESARRVVEIVSSSINPS